MNGELMVLLLRMVLAKHKHLLHISVPAIIHTENVHQSNDRRQKKMHSFFRANWNVKCGHSNIAPLSTI